MYQLKSLDCEIHLELPFIYFTQNLFQILNKWRLQVGKEIW